MTKKMKVIAFGFSENARAKILKAKGEVISIMEEIKKNPIMKAILEASSDPEFMSAEKDKSTNE
jgi:hypothetical protein